MEIQRPARTRPHAESSEGGAMVEDWQTIPWGREMETEPLAMETQVEQSRWRARETLRIRRFKVELIAQATKAETGIRKITVEPEQLRTNAEAEGRRSLTEPEGRSEKAKPEEWSPEAADGQQLTNPEGQGSPVEPVG